MGEGRVSNAGQRGNAPREKGKVTSPMNHPKGKAQGAGGKRKGAERFKALVRIAERYLKDYSEGRRHDHNKARVALRVLSVYRRILKIEKERAKVRLEWGNLLASIAELKRTPPTKKRVSKKPAHQALSGV